MADDLKINIEFNGDDKTKASTQSVEKNIDNVTEAIKDSSKHSKSAADGLNKLDAATKKASNTTSKAEKEQDKFNKNLKNTDAAANSLAGSLKNATKNLIGFFTISKGIQLGRNILQTADNFLLVQSRIKLATDGVIAYTTANASLFKIAQETRSEFGDVANLFSRTNQAVKDLGGSQQTTLDFVKLIGQANKVSGAATSESSASIRQLTQALQSGVLRGDEFNSIMENSPRIARALADGLGVPVGALRNMAEQGELTSERVINAIISQRDAIEKEFQNVPKTVSDVVVKLKNIWSRGIASLNEDVQFSQAIAEELEVVGQLFETFVADLKNNTDGIKDVFNGTIGTFRFFGNAFIVVFNSIQISMRIFVRALFGFAAEVNEALSFVTFGDLSKEFEEKAKNLRATMSDLERDIKGDAQSIGNAIDRMGNSYDPAVIKSNDLKKQHDELSGSIDQTRKVTDQATQSTNSLTKAQNKQLDSLAKNVYDETRTDLEKLIAKQAQYNELLQSGRIDQETYNRAMAKSKDAYKKQTGQSTGTDFSQIKADIDVGTGKSAEDINALDITRGIDLVNRSLEDGDYEAAGRRINSVTDNIIKMNESGGGDQQFLSVQIGRLDELQKKVDGFNAQDLIDKTTVDPETVKNEIENGLKDINPEIPVFMRPDVQDAIAKINAARDQAQAQVKPVEIPVYYVNKGGNSFSDKPFEDTLSDESLQRGRRR